MGVKESEVESFAREEITRRNGLMLKWVSPGQRGVMDDIVIWPDAVIHFIEFKSLRGALSPTQEAFSKKLKIRGCTVFVFRSKLNVIEYVKQYG